MTGHVLIDDPTDVQTLIGHTADGVNDRCSTDAMDGSVIKVVVRDEHVVSLHEGHGCGEPLHPRPRVIVVEGVNDGCRATGRGPAERRVAEVVERASGQ